ncbi:MAG: serine/threonine protein kinase, partial [Phycisphaeraceae bacterium]|nr:serine/threonine protein kinase [Phycisphaeraceae bacterium]
MSNKESCQSCQHCGKAMGAKSIQGLCPACLMKAGWPTSQETGPEGFEPPAIEDVGRLFPQLEILELIGRGGMGAVYKARQPDLDRFVALKILARKAGDDPGFAARFTREAQALARLSHPHIVGVHDFGHTSDLSYFVMEYVDGPNLREIQGAGHLSPAETLAIIPQICDALQFAHDAGVV